MNPRATYPLTPGFKVSGPSAEACPTPDDAATLRGKCLELVKLRGDMTADEAADMLVVDKLAIRPRFSEMRRKGWIFDSGLRRPNSSGKSATVWTIDKQGRLL